MSVPDNRYSELLAQIPKGSFYTTDGIILPVRDSAWQLTLTTPTPNQIYEFYLDGDPQGQVATDVLGNAIINVVLSRGQHTLSLVSGANPNVPLTTYVTILDYSVWLAAYADVFNGIDAGITAVQDNTYLATATSDQISSIWGTRSGVPNNMLYSSDAYRDTLQQIRQAQRRFGGTFGGVNLGVASITITNPLVVSRQFNGPRWILGADYTSNNDLVTRTRYTTSPLTNLNSGGGHYTISAISSDMPLGNFTLYFFTEIIGGVTTKNIEMVDLYGNIAQIAVYTSNATPQWLPFPWTLTPYISHGRLVSLPGPFTLEGGAINSAIALSMDGNPTVYVELGVPAATVTAAQIATAILSAMNTSTIGSPYYGYNSNQVRADSSGRLELVARQIPQQLGTPNNPNGGQITIVPCRIQTSTSGDAYNIDASYLIWGIPWNYTTISTATAPGSYSVIVANASGFPVPTTKNPVKLLISRNNNFNLLILPFEVQAIGLSGNTFTLVEPLAQYCNVGASVEVVGQTPYTVAPPRQPISPLFGDGIQITGTNQLLPSTGTTDVITVKGNQAPDGWYLTSNANTNITEGGFFTYYALSITSTSSADVIMSTPVPASIPMGVTFDTPGVSVADYVGYTLELSFWCKLNQYVIRNVQPVAGSVLPSTIPAQTVVCGISWDGGNTYTEGSQVVLGNTNNFLPEQVTVSTIIPPGATVPAIRLRWVGPTPSTSIFVERVHLTVQLISGLYTGNGTIPRSEQDSKQGVVVYIWSPDQLSSEEYTTLGCPPSPSSLGLPAPSSGSGLSGWTIPATVTPTNPISGITIVQATYDSPVGNGLFVFTAGSPAMFAYQAPGDTVPGTAVALPSTGFYTASSQTTNYQITVEANVPELPSVSSSQTLTVGFMSGLIQTLAPANVSLAPFDVSFYGGSGQSGNIAGAFTEVSYLEGTMTNMQIVLRSPARFTHLAPTQLSLIKGEDIQFSGNSPYVASTLQISNQQQSGAVLYENGIPVPVNLWSFSGPQQITLSYTPLSVQYSLDYTTLIQFTTGTIDAGTSFANYAWYVDFYAYLRQNIVPYSVMVTYGLTFDQNLDASLAEPSDQNQSNSTLQQDNGSVITTVPVSEWSYNDPNSINLNSAAYDPTSVYQLTYNAQSPQPNFGPSILVQYRGATTSAGLSTATFNTVQINQPIGNVNRYHQFQVTFGNVVDLRDFRLYSMLVKGLGLYSGSPVPGLPGTYA